MQLFAYLNRPMIKTSLEQSLLVFKALSDPNRLRLYWLLTHVGEAVCVCEAMRVLDHPQYEASKHLKQLREAGLVEAEKRGRFVYYKVASSNGSFVQGIAQAVNAIDSDSFKEDKQRCKEICCCVSDE